MTVDALNPVALSQDPAFTGFFGRGTSGTSATPPTATRIGERYFDITNKREWLWDGTGWIITYEPLQTYTPRLTGFTLGNGTREGRYWRSGGRCRGTAQILFGSTSSVAASANNGLGTPTAIAGGANFSEIDDMLAMLYDASASRYTGFCYTITNSPGDIGVLSHQVSASNAIQNTLFTGTFPFTWTTGDAVFLAFDYAMQTPYL